MVHVPPVARRLAAQARSALERGKPRLRIRYPMPDHWTEPQLLPGSRLIGIRGGIVELEIECVTLLRMIDEASRPMPEA